MNILAIDTATEVCSVALTGDGLQMERFEDSAPQASRIILAMIDDLMQQAGYQWDDIQLLAFGHGPGSFTGVRVATGLIQGLALGQGLPVLGISTLAAIAWAALHDHADKDKDRPVLAALDARMGELYWACYQCNDAGMLTCMTEDALGQADDVYLPRTGHWLAAGNAITSYAGPLEARLSAANTKIDWLPDITPRALHIAELADQKIALGAKPCTAEQVQPVYLRHRVVQHG